jgi:hypothetical protein
MFTLLDTRSVFKLPRGMRYTQLVYVL